VDSDVLLTSRGFSMGVARERPMKRSMSFRACMLTLLACRSRESGGLGNRNGDMKVSIRSFQEHCNLLRAQASSKNRKPEH
jgi:hypothetical protein